MVTQDEDTEFVGWLTLFRKWFDDGKEMGATHVVYGYMYSGEYQYVQSYVMPGEDPREKARKTGLEGCIEIRFVFNLSVPFDEQWTETKELTRGLLNFD